MQTNLKNIAIFGFGKEGVAAANYLGTGNNISVFDDKPKNLMEPMLFKMLQTKNVKFYFGKDILVNEKFDLVVRSPGVRPDHPKIVGLKEKGAKVTSTTNIFFENATLESKAESGTTINERLLPK